eukprot:5590620-Pyramimonas_sp.AAC.1
MVPNPLDSKSAMLVLQSPQTASSMPSSMLLRAALRSDVAVSHIFCRARTSEDDVVNPWAPLGVSRTSLVAASRAIAAGQAEPFPISFHPPPLAPGPPRAWSAG